MVPGGGDHVCSGSELPILALAQVQGAEHRTVVMQGAVTGLGKKVGVDKKGDSFLLLKIVSNSKKIT